MLIKSMPQEERPLEKAINGGVQALSNTEHTVDAHGGVVQISQELRSIEDYDVRDGRAAVVGLEGLGLQELYLVEAGRERRLTDFNAAALEGKDLSVPEYVRLENGTPEGLDCWYMRPVGFEVGKKYPTLLHIHGGNLADRKSVV